MVVNKSSRERGFAYGSIYKSEVMVFARVHTNVIGGISPASILPLLTLIMLESNCFEMTYTFSLFYDSSCFRGLGALYYALFIKLLISF